MIYLKEICIKHNCKFFQKYYDDLNTGYCKIIDIGSGKLIKSGKEEEMANHCISCDWRISLLIHSTICNQLRNKCPYWKKYEIIYKLKNL